ncbi:MAG: hypothetical protein ACRCX7_11535 [Cetobacterium sp.]|uniref:hypothetical protein n=1 Tax=Cetobacterium sp. TaxID=2071632 RepID=UPI003F29FF8D
MALHIQGNNLKDRYKKVLENKGVSYPEFTNSKEQHIKKNTSEYLNKKEQVNENNAKNTIENIRKSHELNKERIKNTDEKELEKEQKLVARQTKQTLKGFDKNWKKNEEINEAYENWNGFEPEQKRTRLQKRKENRAKRIALEKNMELVNKVIATQNYGYKVIDNKTIPAIDLKECKEIMINLEKEGVNSDKFRNI